MSTTASERHRHLWAELVAQLVTQENVSLESSLTNYRPANQRTGQRLKGEVGFKLADGAEVDVTLKSARVELSDPSPMKGTAELDLSEEYVIGFFNGGPAQRGGEEGVLIESESAQEAASELLNYILEHRLGV